MNVRVAVGKVANVLNGVAKVSIGLDGDQVAKPKGRHDILALDCSGSMVDSIGDLRRDSQKYVKELGQDDYATVVIFSGHGTAKKIAGPTRMDAQGKRLVSAAIEKNVRVMGTTVFSEPLALTLQAAKEAAGEELMHHSILFTDGCPVPTQWSESVERRKAIEQANKLGAFGAILSCLGYGFYYDADFLRELITANGGNGCYLHISEIEEFSDAVNAIKAVVQKMTAVQIELTISTDKGAPSRTFRTTPEVTLVGEGGSIRVSALYDGVADLYVEVPAGSKSIKVTGTLNGQKLTSTMSVDFNSKDQADYVRVLGVHAFTGGDLATAQEMFKQTGDEALADNLGNAYSKRDVREAGNAARAYFRDQKFIGAGLKAVGPNHNILNALRTLIEDLANVATLPNGAYQRSGLLVKDPRVVENPTGSTLQVVGYVSHQERFNFSIRALKNVMVLPENGSTGRPEPKQVWRTYNVVLDGNLRMPELLASLSQESFSSLQEAGVIDKSDGWQKGRSYTLNFRNLKMTSPAWANPTTLRLVDLLKQEAELEAEQKALNSRKKAVAADRKVTTDVDEDNVYRENAKPIEGVEPEYYSAPACEYRLMSYKVKVYDYSTLNFAQADAKVKQVRQELVKVRFMIRAIVFSMEVTKSRVIRWDVGKTTQRGEVPKLEQIATFQGATLKRVTWQETCVCS